MMATPSSNSWWGRVARLALKELRETLRDRRTILTLVLMPVLVYPLLTLGFQKFLLTQKIDGAPHYRIGIEHAREFELVKQLFGEGSQALEASQIGTPAEVSANVIEVPDLSAAVLDNTIDIGLRFVPPAKQQPARRRSNGIEANIDPIEIELFVFESSSPEAAEAWVTKVLRSAGVSILASRLRALGVNQSLAPIRLERKLVRAPQIAHGMSLASIIPVVLVLMTLTGAVYPAIDLTAGERERNTLELLMAAPVPRLGLLIAKYVAVVTVALLTAGLNLASMTATLQASGMGPMVWGPQGASVWILTEIFLLLVLFAGFFSAVLLCITSFARSFKEAQAYLIPVMLLSISPALIAILPGMKLGGWLTVLPMLNVNLLARDILAHDVQFSSALIVVVTTLFYGAAALGLASRIFGADAVLYDARSGWGEIWQRPATPQSSAPLSTALLSVAMLFPATFIAAGSIAQLAGTETGPRLLLNSLASALLYVAAPLVLSRLQRVNLRTGFQLQPFSLLAVPGALLLGLSLWPFAHEIVIILSQLGLTTISPELIERSRTMIDALRNVPVAAILLALAIVPAVTEEFLFRGYLFSALLRRLPAASSILLSGVMFGVFHLVATDGLAVERLFPSTCLGLVLAWVCWRTGSVLPGMLLHTVHNGLLLLLMYYEPTLSAGGWLPTSLADPASIEHLPWLWLALATLGTAAGAALIALTRPRLRDSR